MVPVIAANDRVVIVRLDGTLSILHVRPGSEFRLNKVQVSVDSLIGKTK
jgi:hypothetical protein